MKQTATEINKLYKLKQKREKEEKKRVSDLNKRYAQKMVKLKEQIEKKKIRDKKRLENKIAMKYEKKEREVLKKPILKKHTKTKTTAKLKQELYKLVQLYSRLRDSDIYGYGKCISCDRVVHYKKSDGGHYISRKYMMSAFDPDNINLQCKYCNGQLKGNVIEYRKRLIEKIGLKKVEQLENDKFKIRDWKRSEILELIEKYKKENKKLEDSKQKPLL